MNTKLECELTQLIVNHIGYKLGLTHTASATVLITKGTFRG